MLNLICGDSLDVLKGFADASVDSIVTDPPYELGFMGKAWDASGIAYNVELWRECLRVLKPGGHLLAFSGSRTYHRMTCAIEDAGFEIRDQIQWIYGSGFPKSLDVSKAIDKAAGAERKVVGESPFARKKPNGSAGVHSVGLSDKPGAMITAPATDDAKAWEGWGTALKPAHEPVCVARRPLVGTVAQNVLEHGVGGLNIDGCRIGSEGGCRTSTEYMGGDAGNAFGKGLNDQRSPAIEGLGRWPSNVIMDEKAGTGEPWSRFFYCPKASKADRGEFNTHPTVKPCDLMRYLVRLVTPTGGTVLDPFMGSGSTGKACAIEGFGFIGIDLEAEHVEIARQRIEPELAGCLDFAA